MDPWVSAAILGWFYNTLAVAMRSRLGPVARGCSQNGQMKGTKNVPMTSTIRFRGIPIFR